MRSEALAALECARLVGARSAPFFASGDALDERVGWGATVLVSTTGKLPDVLDGSSFGLPMVLAAISQSACVRVPSTVAATGTVYGDGAVGRVAGLAEKVAAVERFALGVTKLLVPKGQGEEASAAVRHRGIQIVEVADADHAARETFPNLQTDLQGLWASDPALAGRVARELYRTSLGGHPALLGWSGVAEAASALLRALPHSAEESRIHAMVAESIGRRHQGLAARLSMSDEQLARGRRTERSELLAHIVQAAADVNDEDALREARRAAARIPPHDDRIPADFRVLGAIGRAYAHAGAHREACAALEEAVHGWFAEANEDQASHALGAWALTLGQAGDRDGLEALERAPWRRTYDDRRTTNVSRGFLSVALARAWIQAGAAERGRPLLEPGAQGATVTWDLVPAHLQRGRLRWWALALQQLGADAEPTRDLLRTHHAHSPQRLLAEVDGALADFLDDAQLATLEEEVRGHSRLQREHDRYARRGRTDTARARLSALAHWFPY
jgi:hypothetical protein